MLNLTQSPAEHRPLLQRQEGIIRRKEQEYYFQALFNIPARLLSEQDDRYKRGQMVYYMLETREALIAPRL